MPENIEFNYISEMEGKRFGKIHNKYIWQKLRVDEAQQWVLFKALFK